MLTTKRLILRPLDQRDARTIALLAGDIDVARMTGRIPHPYSDQLAEQWMTGLADGEFVRGIEFGKKLAGVCGFTPLDTTTAEIGYWVGKPWWGRGIATEAASRLIAYCFEVRGFSQITCCHFLDNVASARVIGKLGFKLVGPCKGWSEARQTELDTQRYVLINPALARAKARAAE